MKQHAAVFSVAILLAIIDIVTTSCAQINLAKCTCDYPRDRRFYINCQRLGLTSMPSSINRSLSNGEAQGNFSYNAINKIPDKYFSTMQYYDVLDFTSNKISSFGPNTLDGLGSTLTHLYLSRNNIKSIPLDALKRLIRLNTLDLSGNTISSPCGIMTADIMYYSLASNGISRLADNCFPSSTKVIDLDLSHNRINHVGFEAFKGMEKLESLDLGYNNLADLGDGLNSLISLPMFESLSLKGNNLQYLSSICRHKLPGLKSLDLGYNNLIDLQKYCFSAYSTTSDGSPDLMLNFEHNSVPSLAGSAFAGLDKRLTRLLLNHNQITEVDVTTFNKLKRLIYLNLDNNMISSLEFLRNWEDNDLQELSLANNVIHDLSPNVFQKLIKLTKLTLDGNYLLYIESNAFSGMSLLNDLSIQYNLMTNLADGAFTGLGQLRKLKLTGNGLVTLKNCTFASLDRLVQFHYEDNLLHCDCDLLWLLPYANHVNDRGIPDETVSKPILEDVCHYPKFSAGLIVANEVSKYCNAHATNACFGLEVAYDEPEENQMNVTWSYGTQSNRVQEIKMTQLEIESNTMLYEEDVTSSPMPVTLKQVEDDKIYKICVTLTLDNLGKEMDCTIYPKMIRKPTTTTAPTTTEMADPKGLRSGDVAAIILAIILIILIVLIVLFAVYLWKTDKLRGVTPNKRYGQQTPIHDDSDARSSSQSPSSNGKHDDPLDFRPAENSPMIGGGRTYQEHDL